MLHLVIHHRSSSNSLFDGRAIAKREIGNYPIMKSHFQLTIKQFAHGLCRILKHGNNQINECFLGHNEFEKQL